MKKQSQFGHRIVFLPIHPSLQIGHATMQLDPVGCFVDSSKDMYVVVVFYHTDTWTLIVDDETTVARWYVIKTGWGYCFDHFSTTPDSTIKAKFH